MTSNRLVIGLDYGTTFTGVSYCETSSNGVQGDSIQIIHDWPSAHTSIGTLEKVPSEISYANGNAIWGSLIAPDAPRHMWTKLQLDPKQDKEASKIFREIALSSANLEKQPVDIIADYLTQIRLHLVKNLDRKYGKALWQSMPITLVVTVPAVWSDLAKSQTLTAVAKAGFDVSEFPKTIRTLLATEPESAALYTIKALEGTTQENKFKVGDGFMVCDMGGGTVDLISYKIVGLKPTIIEEATVGTGAQCGGSFVDRAFLGWLEHRLGTSEFVKIAGCRSEEVPYISLSKKAARLLQSFRYEVKGGFSGTENNFLPLPYPLCSLNDESKGIQDGEIEITAEDMEKMFDKPIRSTYELIARQKNAAAKKNVKLKYIFLVGGFAESPYMHKKIEEFARDMNLTAIKPVYAWSAVARGAVSKGLEAEIGGDVTVVNRKCRRFYGEGCSVPFEKSKHREIDSYLCEFDGTKMAGNQVEWLLEKGEDIPTTETPHASIPFVHQFWAGERRMATLDLLAADVDRAPKRSSEQVYDQNSSLLLKADCIYTVYIVASIEVDLTDVPDEHFQLHRSPDGRVYYELSCDIEITLESALEYSLVVGGKKYGSLIATYK